MFARLKQSLHTGHNIDDAPDEAAIVQNVRQTVVADSTLREEQLSWVDDACLVRFVRASKCNHDVAVTRLRATLSWRADARVDSILPAPTSPEFEVLRNEANCGKMFVLPEPDARGRSIIVMRPGLQLAENAEANIRYLIYTLERAARISEKLPGGETRYIVIVDYAAGEFSLRRGPSVSTSKTTLHIMQNHYPERLSHAFLFDAPSFFLPVFRMLRPLIDPVTFGKIHFVRREHASNDPVCADVLQSGAVPVEYGGKLKYDFLVDDYFKDL